MDPTAQREMMVRQATAMVVVMLSFFVTRLRRIRAQLEPIPYGPRSLSQQHRLGTLQMILNNPDAECLTMLRMTRAPFFALCNLFRGRGLVRETSGCSVEEQVAMCPPCGWSQPEVQGSSPVF